MNIRYISLFSGLECAWLAWHPLGWECAAVSEIDPMPCIVLFRRLNASRPKYMPDPNAEGLSDEDRQARQAAIRAVAWLPEYGTPGTLPNLGDVSQATDEDIAALGHVDLLIGGSPCQDLSIAGKRRGLAGSRSGLYFEQLRIFNAARHFCGCRFLVWENVPGALSSNAGRDFAVVVGEMAGLDLDVPEDGWGTEGVALGDNGFVEWCVLDAQWFGVAQRRRRVFALLDIGDWAGRSPVLLERDSVRGDSAPRRGAGQRTTGCLTASSGKRGGRPDDRQLDGLHYEVAPGMTCRTGTGPGRDGMDEYICAEQWPAEVASTLNAKFGSKLRLENQHALNGAPLFVPATMDEYIAAVSPTVTSKWATGSGGPSGSETGNLIATAFSCKDHGADAGDIAPTLRAMGHGGSHANAGGQVAIAFGWQEARQLATTKEHTHALTKNQTVAVQPAEAMAVRRLTPRECERLQGVEDDWTLVQLRTGKWMADGPRYKMLGNSFARPVITWIGQQVERARQEAA